MPHTNHTADKFTVVQILVLGTLFAAICLLVVANMSVSDKTHGKSFALTKPDGTTQIVEYAEIFRGSVEWTTLDGTTHSANSAGYTVTVTKKKETP